MAGTDCDDRTARSRVRQELQVCNDATFRQVSNANAVVKPCIVYVHVA
jgi:hypothetical protein